MIGPTDAQRLLERLLMAAVVGRTSLPVVAHWLLHPEDDEPVRLLLEGDERAAARELQSLRAVPSEAWPVHREALDRFHVLGGPGGPQGCPCGCPSSAVPTPSGLVGVPAVRWDAQVCGWVLRVAVAAAAVWFWATAVLLVARIIDEQVVVHGVTSPASLLSSYYVVLALICAVMAAAVPPRGSHVSRDVVLAGAVGPLLLALGPAALVYPGALAWVVAPFACAWSLHAIACRVAPASWGLGVNRRAAAPRDRQVA